MEREMTFEERLNRFIEATERSSAVIPNTVKTIGTTAFYGNPLSTVTLGANVDCGFGSFFYFNYVCNDRQGGPTGWT